MNNSKVAEIVTFRLNKGADADAFAKAAAGLDPFLDRAQGFIARTLSADEDGNWTEHVVWETLEDAQRASKEIMSAPEAGEMMAPIDTATVKMRHDMIMARK